MSHQTKLRSAIAVMAGFLLVLTGVSTAEAATARSVTLGAAPKSQLAGSPVTFYGHVSKSGTGVPVKLQRLVGSAWVNVTSTSTTDSTGAYSLKINIPTAPATYSFRTTAPATGSYNLGVSSAVSVTATGPVASPPTITTTTLPDGDKGIAYSTTLAKAGGAGTWSIAAGAAQTGLSLAPSTGVLSGTPTGAGTAHFTVKFTETATGLSDTQPLTLVISPLPAITTASLPNVVRGAAYSTTLTKTGKPGTWTITGLPAGLTIGAETGTISGTTTAVAGTYGVYPVFTETSTGRQVLKPLALTVVESAPGDGPTITTTSLPDADKSVAYSATLTKTGGAGTWSVIGGALPAGITLASSTGVLSGTPTAGGTASFTVKFTETATGLAGTKALTLLVTPLPTITTTSLPDVTRGTPYSTTLTKTGKPGTWTITGLPTGLSIDGATGTISGTTTAAAGTYGVYPVFTETSTGRQVLKAFALTLVGGPPPVTGPTITTTSVPTGITGTAYSTQLAKTGAAGTWLVKSGNLPPGIAFSSAGLLSGTPTDVGDYGFTVQFTETTGGAVDTQAYLLHVEAPNSPQITTGALLPDGTIGSPYSVTLDGDGTGTWAVIYDILPPGTSLDAATGKISGTPQVAGNFLFIVRYTTSTGTNTKAFNIHIDPLGPPSP